MPPKIPMILAVAVLAAGCTAQQQQSAASGVNDAYLVSAVGAKIASVDVDAVTAVHVSSDSNGVITLKGAAHSAAERARYVAAAKSVDGVKSVQDELTVNPNAEGLRGQTRDAALAARISAAIAGQTGVNAFHIKPSVHEGTVTLQGSVPSQSVHQTVLQTVRRVPGVTNVVDRIVVSP